MANAYEKKIKGSVTSHLWTFDADGVGAEITWTGGNGTFAVANAGTLGGGTVTFEWKPYEAADFSVLGLAVTALTAPAQHLRVSPGTIRPSLTGATAPTLEVYAV